ncbi:MAG: phosphoribosylglycinamide formyltransferase [Candidatus Peregrinibacteria bacterium]|nr:phosphoribosylglycinamide formyltransferase [Candidatus Peregrinibacteria bacterium]
MQSTPFRIVVLASTNGTDLQAIIDEMKADKMPGIELAAVISNKKNCYALQRAKEQGYEAIYISKNDPHTHAPRTREQFDAQLFSTIETLNPDLVVLVGYMRILTPGFIENLNKKHIQIINIHPALIPKFSGPSFFGKSVHEAVLAAHEKETGMTIHRVTADVDAGEILLQESIPIDQTDTVDTLKQKVQALEKQYYPEVIRQLAKAKTT